MILKERACRCSFEGRCNEGKVAGRRSALRRASRCSGWSCGVESGLFGGVTQARVLARERPPRSSSRSPHLHDPPPHVTRPKKTPTTRLHPQQCRPPVIASALVARHYLHALAIVVTVTLGPGLARSPAAAHAHAVFGSPIQFSLPIYYYIHQPHTAASRAVASGAREAWVAPEYA